MAGEFRMKFVQLRLDPKLWKKLARDKERQDMTWEEYIASLFKFKEEIRVLR